MSRIVTVGPPSMSRLFRQCGILDVSQAYRPPRPVTGTAVNIEMVNKEAGREGVDWIHVAQVRD
jgi:hypothetical protein